MLLRFAPRTFSPLLGRRRHGPDGGHRLPALALSLELAEEHHVRRPWPAHLLPRLRRRAKEVAMLAAVTLISVYLICTTMFFKRIFSPRGRWSTEACYPSSTSCRSSFSPERWPGPSPPPPPPRSAHLRVCEPSEEQEATKTLAAKTLNTCGRIVASVLAALSLTCSR